MCYSLNFVIAGEAEGKHTEKLSKKKRREQKRRERELLEGDDMDDGDGDGEEDGEPMSLLAAESIPSGKGVATATAGDVSGDSSASEAGAGFELVDR